MQRDEDILAFPHPEALEDVARAGRLGTLQGDIVHHVPDEVHPAADALLDEVVDRGLRGTEQERGEVVRDDPIDLLGHRAIEGPETGLDVSERAAHLRRDERARERRVRVPVHEDEIGLLPLEDVLETVHHLRGLAGVTAASNSEVVVRPRHVEDLEEHVGHVLVVMLPGVDQDLLVVLANLPAHRRGLDELRACADDARDFHGRQSGRTAYNDIVPNDPARLLEKMSEGEHVVADGPARPHDRHVRLHADNSGPVPVL